MIDYRDDIANALVVNIHCQYYIPSDVSGDGYICPTELSCGLSLLCEGYTSSSSVAGGSAQQQTLRSKAKAAFELYDTNDDK
jgi:hypothetical protein